MVRIKYLAVLATSFALVAAVGTPARADDLLQVRLSLTAQIGVRVQDAPGLAEEGKADGALVSSFGIPPESYSSALLLRSNLRFGLYSSPIRLIPRAELIPWKSCSLIYSAGHSGQAAGATDLIVRALQTGCDVYLLEMPRFGGVDIPSPRNPSLARVGALSVDLGLSPLHEGFKTLEFASSSNALDIFIQPIFDTVSYIEASQGSSTGIVLAGLSGGGWATVLAAALDDRVKLSASVAGSTPSQSPFGDYEQSHPLLLGVGYEKLYALASAGTRREHLQVLNWNDPCCFAREDPAAWAPTVRSQLSSGAFEYFVDNDVVDHAVSPAVGDLIVNGLQSSSFGVTYERCFVGTWSPTGRRACRQADPGKYVPEEGATKQSDCPSGFSSAPGARSASECFATPQPLAPAPSQ